MRAIALAIFLVVLALTPTATLSEPEKATIVNVALVTAGAFVGCVILGI